MSELKCPECGSRMALRQGRYSKFYGCTRFPICTVTHGAHQGTGEPLGVPADEETRKARREAHLHFDMHWKREPEKDWKEARPAAYKWLAERLGIPVDECHIGRFDLETCRRVIVICKAQNLTLED